MKLLKLKSLINRRALATLLVIGALGAAACGGDSPATAVPKSETPARQVRVVAAAQSVAARVVSASGTLAAEDQFVLGTKVVGRLGEITVDLGSRVKQRPSDRAHRPKRLSAARRTSGRRAAAIARPSRDSLPSGSSDKVDIEQTATGAPGGGGAQGSPPHPRPDGRTLGSQTNRARRARQRGIPTSGGGRALSGCHRRSPQSPGGVGAAPFRARDRAPTACRYRHRFAHRRRRQRTPGVRRPVPAGRRAGRDSGAH